MRESPDIYAEVISELGKGVALKDKEDGSSAWEYDAEATNRLMQLAAIYLEHLASDRAAARVLSRVKEIAEDFIPDNERQAMTALEEMREALMAIVANPMEA